MNTKHDSSAAGSAALAARPDPTRHWIVGAGLGILAVIVFWRAPQFAVVGFALVWLAAKQRTSFQRLEKQWAESQAASTPPRRESAGGAGTKQALPILLVSRRARDVDTTNWTQARSWLGGAPRLGSVPWPRRKSDGRPMPFLAQIDLAEVAARIGPSPLPSTGALAFFVGDQPVRYVAELQPADFTPVPDDAPTLDEAGYSGTGVVAWPNDPMGPKLFPFWPVDLTVVPGEVPGREFSFSEKQAEAALEGEPLPRWWHSALLFADGLRVASTLGVPNKLRVLRQGVSDPKRSAALEAFQRGLPAFEAFVAEVAAWARGRDPWAFLAAADDTQLASLFERARTEFGEYTRFSIPHSLEALRTATLVELASAEARAYATMPPRVRRLINETCLLPVWRSHQMFGGAIDIQGFAAELAETNYLLLRLNHDDMLHWGFGDAGAYHFFISPDNLAKRNWEAAQMTFECG